MCLWHAIRKLSDRETGSFSVFTGLKGVKLDRKMIKDGYFVTYVSASWNKQVSKMFIQGDTGMMIEIDKEYKDHMFVYCCDVSWISRFPDECEILFARSRFLDNFSLAALDDSNGVQTVSLKP